MDNATLTGAGAGLGLASIKMAAALLIVLGLIFLALALLKRFGLASRLQGRGPGSLRVEERVALGPRKQLVVVRFLNRLLVLGVTDAGINLIAEHKADHDPTPDFQTALERVKAARILLPSLLLLFPLAALAQQAPSVPSLSLSLSSAQAEPQKVAVALEVMALLTVLSLAPAIVLTVTSFTRIIIVFHFLRQAMGIQQMPPNQVLASLAIFMTVVIMMPTGRTINDTALQPYLKEEIGYDVAIERAQEPLRTFLFKHTREKDLSVFFSITGLERPKNKDEVPTMVLIPAYLISELKTGFQIGFLIYIPFLILDMVVASILLSMGMMMLPPVMVSLPFKVLLFVMVDGWNLIIGSLVNSFV